MPDRRVVAIVDYGMGNLFSVSEACAHAGLVPTITSSPAVVDAADAVIVPGIGAFGDAMARLRELGLVERLRAIADAGRPLIGICLGMQLLMSESEEFGRHMGLDLIQGLVTRLPSDAALRGGAKVPQVGWNAVRRVSTNGRDPWHATPLAGLTEPLLMYFVHSYYVAPRDSGVVMGETEYAGVTFCTALRHRNVFGFQFHPERSGEQGLQVYRNLAVML